MRRLKIGIFTEWFLPETGGGETHIYNLANWLKEKGNEVHIITSKRIYEKLNKREDIKLPFKIHYMKEPPRRFGNARKFSLANYWAYVIDMALLNVEGIEKLKLDIFHGHSTTFWYVAIFLGEMLNIPSVVTLHLNHLFIPSYRCIPFCTHYEFEKCRRCKIKFPWLNTTKEKVWGLHLRRFFIQNADRIITVSSFGKNYLLKYQRFKSNVTLIPNWVDPDMFCAPKKDKVLIKKYRIKEDDKIILYVGRIFIIKGIDYLIKAMPEILKKYPTAKLVIAGRVEHLARDKYVQKIKKLVARLKLTQHVIFTRNIPYTDMPKIYSLGDVFVLPSFIEAQGLVILEAMAAKLPVVATALPTVKEFVKNNKNGLLVKPRNSKAISQAVIKVLSNPKLQKKLTRNGEYTVRNKFAADKILPRIVKIYEQEIKSFKGRA